MIREMTLADIVPFETWAWLGHVLPNGVIAYSPHNTRPLWHSNDPTWHGV